MKTIDILHFPKIRVYIERRVLLLAQSCLPFVAGLPRVIIPRERFPTAILTLSRYNNNDIDERSLGLRHCFTLSYHHACESTAGERVSRAPIEKKTGESRREGERRGETRRVEQDVRVAYRTPHQRNALPDTLSGQRHYRAMKRAVRVYAKAHRKQRNSTVPCRN